MHAYGHKVNGIYRAAVQRLDEAGAELFLDLGNVEHADTLGQWLTLDPKDSPLLEDTSIPRIYALDVQYP
jgi:hypothetical protein